MGCPRPGRAKWTAPKPQPNLLLTRGSVVRHGTGFSVSLNLTNKGQGDAGNISLSDTVQGFQILPNGLVSNNDMTVASEYITGTKKCTASIVVGDLAAGASTTGTYYVVPALFESSITYDIGTETQITYELPYVGTGSGRHLRHRNGRLSSGHQSSPLDRIVR